MTGDRRDSDVQMQNNMLIWGLCTSLSLSGLEHSEAQHTQDLSNTSFWCKHNINIQFGQKHVHTGHVC